ncbi:hypothetical protein PFISCL1PPCAC_29052 [Pristionchus fissidentatus]|uniref:BED-type domain-containing protein n=2 Tax=Pristionchus fissidentatus TaxID=1538716 RepID=A0AAV5X3G9_9BILA|nr:hypothetical protein PFISCL1PPCAC_29052 [Pristionchus fissidentatus]
MDADMEASNNVDSILMGLITPRSRSDPRESIDTQSVQSSLLYQINRGKKMGERRTISCNHCTVNNIGLRNFMKHLSKVHNSTPVKSKISFKCACGFISGHYMGAHKHKNECDQPAFSLIPRWNKQLNQFE